MSRFCTGVASGTQLSESALAEVRTTTHSLVNSLVGGMRRGDIPRTRVSSENVFVAVTSPRLMAANRARLHRVLRFFRGKLPSAPHHYSQRQIPTNIA